MCIYRRNVHIWKLCISRDCHICMLWKFHIASIYAQLMCLHIYESFTYIEDMHIYRRYVHIQNIFTYIEVVHIEDMCIFIILYMHASIYAWIYIRCAYTKSILCILYYLITLLIVFSMVTRLSLFLFLYENYHIS